MTAPCKWCGYDLDAVNAGRPEDERFMGHLCDPVKVSERARAEEREACAVICDAVDRSWEFEGKLAEICARRIRARGQGGGW
jgi:hypothetical protein